MRFSVALFWLISLLGMQVHSLVPHHHHDEHIVSRGHEIHHDHGDAHPSAQAGDCEMTHERDHHHLHDRSELDDARTPRTPRYNPHFVAILPDAYHLEIVLPHVAPARIAHQIEPFQTGPPGTTSSRAPPVPVA